MQAKIIILLISLILGGSVSAQTFTQADTLTTHTMRGTFYSNKFVGRKTSSGERFSQEKYTAAHRSIKLGTIIIVTNPKNGKQVLCKVNDRCPKSGIIDLSRIAANAIGITSHTVEVQILPERFRDYWENQEQYRTLLEKGTFLAAVEQGKLHLNPAVRKAAANQTESTPANTQSKTSVKAKTTPDIPKQTIPLYDLEICTISPDNDPTIVIEKLPIHYRNKVRVETTDGEKRLILSLGLCQEDAKVVQADIYTLFPRSKMVPSK